MTYLRTLVLIILLINYTFQRRKQKTKPKKKYDPMTKLPKHITKEQLCIGCYGLNKELLNNLRGKKREFEVFDGLKEVCDSNFNNYGKRILNIRLQCR